MTDKVVSAEATIHAPAPDIFEHIANPLKQIAWDGNDNLVSADGQERVTTLGDVFAMKIHNGTERDNHVTEFDEGRLIAWKPATQGEPPAGHIWRWELEATGDGETLVRHTYDWSELTDEARMQRAKSTTGEDLLRSIMRLKAIVEGGE